MVSEQYADGTKVLDHGHWKIMGGLSVCLYKFFLGQCSLASHFQGSRVCICVYVVYSLSVRSAVVLSLALIIKLTFWEAIRARNQLVGAPTPWFYSGRAREAMKKIFCM
jgi:hypothetical protein